MITEEELEYITIPTVALPGLNVLPGAMVHFDVSRLVTVKSVEEAMLGDQQIFITAQKDDDRQIPNKDDVESIGCVAIVKQIIKLSDDLLRVMVIGVERAVLDDIKEEDDRLIGEIYYYIDHSMDCITSLEKKAMLDTLRTLVLHYAGENGRLSKNTMKKLNEVDRLDRLLDEVALILPLTTDGKQRVLNKINLSERFQYVSVLLTQELELFGIKRNLQNKVKDQVDQNQKEYLLREQLKVIREELGESTIEDEADQYVKGLDKLKASDEIKEKIKKEIDRFKNVSSTSSENAVIRGYVETLLAMPWEKSSKDYNNIKHAEEILNEDHYGLKKVKDRILEFLAVRNLTGKGEAPIVCLVGPPGTGKTSIAKSVARSLNKKYVRICLGGVRDEAEIRGHRRTYVGAMPGRIASGLKNAGVKNPLMLLDEVDKVGTDQRGDTASALLEVLDSEQNSRFVDHYVELPIDLSEVLFIATANTVQTIPQPLLDRMELIEVSSYTENEKFHIAKEHLIQKQKEKNGLKPKQLYFVDRAVELMISGYTREAGVRSLERKIGEICRKAARDILEKDKKQIKVTEKNLEKFLGKVKYSIDEANEQDDVGIVRGLAWTSVGGETLQIEVNVMPGKGKFELTGQMGDVMKESAKTGISYVRSISDKYHVDHEFYEKKDIHIHIPEGAVPKDGPSAGITMATAILSAVTGHKVSAHVAMTGEITLRGRVLPVGGLKEKILAAKMAKIDTVLVPKQNRTDIEEIEKEILENIDIKYVDTMDEVIKLAII